MRTPTPIGVVQESRWLLVAIAAGAMMPAILDEAGIASATGLGISGVMVAAVLGGSKATSA